jgi:hypothetical protein
VSKVSSPPILNKESMPDAPEGEWLDRILDYSNGFNDQVAKALRNGVTLSDNTPYKTQSYILKHGVETEIVPPLAKGLSIKGVSVMQCEGIEVDATTQKPTGKVYSLALANPINWRPSGKPSGSIYVTANYGGNIGETVSANVTSGNAITLATSNTAQNITSIPLTAGEWQVNGVIQWTLNGATVSAVLGSLNTVSATPGTSGDNVIDIFIPTAATNSGGSIPGWAVSASAAVTAYLIARSTFSAGNPKAWGRISAFRTKIDPATFGRLNLLFYGE